MGEPVRRLASRVVCAVYVLSVIALIPDLRRPKTDDAAWLVRRLALAYVVVFGLVAEWLVVTPYLPKLWNDTSSLVTALLSFLPLLWLAIIDHAATRPVRYSLAGLGTKSSPTADKTSRPVIGRGDRFSAACWPRARVTAVVSVARASVADTFLRAGSGDRRCGLGDDERVGARLEPDRDDGAVRDPERSLWRSRAPPAASGRGNMCRSFSSPPRRLQASFLVSSSRNRLWPGCADGRVARGRHHLGLTWSAIALRRPRRRHAIA